MQDVSSYAGRSCSLSCEWINKDYKNDYKNEPGFLTQVSWWQADCTAAITIVLAIVDKMLKFNIVVLISFFHTIVSLIIDTLQLFRCCKKVIELGWRSITIRGILKITYHVRNLRHIMFVIYAMSEKICPCYKGD